MKTWYIYFDNGGDCEYGLVVGIVLDKDGSHSADDALNAWNNANPSYLGNRAADGRFMEI